MTRVHATILSYYGHFSRMASLLFCLKDTPTCLNTDNLQELLTLKMFFIVFSSLTPSHSIRKSIRKDNLRRNLVIMGEMPEYYSIFWQFQ